MSGESVSKGYRLARVRMGPWGTVRAVAENGATKSRNTHVGIGCGKSRTSDQQFPQNRRRQVANPDLRRALGRDRFPVCSQYRGESHALLAMGLTEDQAHCVVRYSLGTGNTQGEIDLALAHLEEVLHDTAGAIRFIGCR